MKIVPYTGRNTLKGLGRTLVGFLSLVCVPACQTIGAEPSSNEGQTIETVQSRTAVEARDTAHVNFQNIADKNKFYGLPKTTHWTIVSLADFTLKRDVPQPSGRRYSYKLSDHRVEATKDMNSAVLVLSDIPSCEGAGGRIVIAGADRWQELADGIYERIIDYSPTGVEYTVLQGACSEIVLLPDGTTQKIAGTYADMIMFNLIPVLRAKHMWDLRGDRLLLFDAKLRQRAEFLRTTAPT